ncbi:MAG: M28 family metallopeptidase [Candidatus Andeanibacterium colombiense]|uniref:M28 family metallopeptidase n=1 Tax=Candidatus Andeanibacterium colombiense TaxID=3121345 RepID=A0AAJ5X980_9SPHN|nr:MAG: M28 family metallopeptidase [Sphingomonadaceae bacterium]
MLLAGCASTGGGEIAPAPLDIPPVPPANVSTATMREVTRELSADSYEGRFPGSKGEDKTLAFLMKKWAGIGLQPGNHGGWLQDVPLVEITGRNFAPLTIAGKNGGLSLAHGSEWVGSSFREDAHIALTGSELVFVGYGIYAPEKGWNDYAGIDMRGKTAVILVNDPDWNGDQPGGLFGGKAMTYYGRWTYKFEEAARQGASAALIVHDTYPASYGWNVIENGRSGPQVHAEHTGAGAEQTLVNGWIQHDAARQLMAAAGKDLTGLEALAMRKGFKPVPLGLTISTAFDNTVRRYTSHNVIGILPGSARPDEYVLHSAHWDHLGRCKANAKGDDICNGAIDNAAGVGAITALAEAQVKAGPAPRSMVFIALTAEEQGLLGSDYYAANPVFPLDHTVGGLNIDTPLLAGPARDVTVIGGGKSQLDGFLARALAGSGRYATADPNPQAGLYYRSDHFSFAKHGVPMLYLDGGEDFVTGGKAAGAAWQENYTLTRYHSPDDEFDPKWDWSAAGPDLELEYRLGRMLATSTSWPNWVEGDEFRRIRDESCKPAGGC